MTQVIAVTNRKGGTGKTTVTVNLAAAFAACGRRVLVIDLDSQGHAAIGLGVGRDRPAAATIHHLWRDPQARLREAILATPYPNLWVAPADPRFDHGSGLRNDLRLSAALAEDGAGEPFELVFIDTPPSLDMLLVNALYAADWVLVPFIPHPLAFEGIRQLVRALYPIMADRSRVLRLLGFVPVMANEQFRQHRAITHQVTQQFGALRLLPAIRTDIKIAEAFAAGKPIFAYAPHSRGASDFARLADSVATLLAENG